MPSDHAQAAPPGPTNAHEARAARRRFLNACGRFAIATPPAIALLLAASERKYAVAQSGGGGPIERDD